MHIHRPSPRTAGAAIAGLLLGTAVTLSIPTVSAADTVVGDAGAVQGANACTWTMSTAAIAKTVTFSAGSFTMTSLKNKLVSGAREYEQSGTASPEFQLSWDGTALSGASGGWTCASGSSSSGTAGGQSVVLVNLTLTRATLRVTMHYIVYPSESLIRQSTDYTNTDTAAHTLANPSFLAQHVMQGDTASVDANYLTGAQATAGAWTPQTIALSTAGSRAFDSYDPFGCNGWSNIGTYSASGYLGMPEWHDTGGFVWPGGEHPGEFNDTARTFTAPSTGVVGISGTAAKMNTSGNGVVVRITENGRTVWGPTTIAGTDTTGVSTSVSNLSVTAGDAIRFEINNNGDWQYDATSWNPTVAYTGGGSYTASTGFSSTQGVNQWSYQDYRGCSSGGFQASSTDYIPWLGLWNRVNNDGLYAGLEYHGRWQARVGNADGGAGDLTAVIPNYNSPLAAGATMASPYAFVGTYVTDTDDMTNRLLDWQYRYLWDYTRSAYFAKIRMLGYWWAGAETIPPTASTAAYDPNGIVNQVVGLTARMRSIGADVWHRDYGWWTTPWGDWNGPDWKTTNDYLAKSGMRQLIYYPAYYASSGSNAYDSNPGMFPYPGGQGQCYGGNLTDFNVPGAVSRMQNLLTNNATAWGDYAWRGDTCWMQDATGATQLGQQNGFYSALTGFLNAKPNSAFQAVNDGGNEASFDYLRYASSLSFTDSSGKAEFQGASTLFPMDKMSGIPDQWNPAGCNASYNVTLAWNPDFTGDTTDPTALACMHQLVSTYHYLVAKGVAGRYAKQFHPRSTDGSANWYERTSQDGAKGVLVYAGGGTGSSVTVTPKGLVGGTTYDVRTATGTVLASATGSTLMSSGITLSGVPVGTLVYLNLPNYPGSAADTVAPTAPTAVTATVNTDMSQPGVELTWAAGTDANWLDHYEIQRNGTTIDTVTSGTFYFDRGPAASTQATYQVRSVDGAGHTSAWAAAATSGTAVTAVDDGALTYSGTWVHDTTSYPQAYGQSLSGSHTTGDYAQYTFTGNRVVLYARPSPDSGNADVIVDGTTDATLNLFTSTNQTYEVPVYTKTWPTSGSHTIRVKVDGTKDSRATDTYVVLDGLQTSAAAVTTTEDSSGALTYSGSGWQHNSGTYTQASNADISWTNRPGDSVSYTFTGSQIAWIAEPGTNKGEADVSIDGTFVTRVDLYPGTGADWFRSAVFRKSFPTSGTHTITITVVGKHAVPSIDNYITVDAFAVS